MSDKCVICGGEHGIVYDVNGFRGLWVHLSCAQLQNLPEQYNPDYPCPLIVDGSEPLPDPAWDYAQIYYRAVSIRREVEALFGTLEVDDGTPEIDQAIRDHLRQMSAQINAAMGELD